MKRADVRPFSAVQAPTGQLLHHCLERWQAMSAPYCSCVVPLAMAVCPACADCKMRCSSKATASYVTLLHDSAAPRGPLQIPWQHDVLERCERCELSNSALQLASSFPDCMHWMQLLHALQFFSSGALWSRWWLQC